MLLFLLTSLTDSARSQTLKDSKDYKKNTPSDVQAYGVCPFTNASKIEKFNWISDGIAESISSDMKLANYIVVDRIHVKDTIKEIGLGQTGLVDEKSASKSGLMIGASFLVIGSYQIYNNNIRIVSKVIKTETGEIINIARVTGKLDSIFDLQDSLFEKMFKLDTGGQKSVFFSNVKLEIKKKPTKNLDAYKYYLLCEEYNYRGASLDDPNTKKHLSESVKYGLKAIQIDPKMTIAYLKLSHTYAGLADDYNTKRMLKLARESIGPETNIIVKNLVYANFEIRINKDFRKAISYYVTVLDQNSSNIEALWQLWAIYRGAFGSTVYDKSISNKYRDDFLKYHPKSILTAHIKKYSAYDRLR